jgi:hypothetical protein
MEAVGDEVGFHGTAGPGGGDGLPCGSAVGAEEDGVVVVNGEQVLALTRDGEDGQATRQRDRCEGGFTEREGLGSALCCDGACRGILAEGRGESGFHRAGRGTRV